jgi:MFS family permease
MTQATDITAPQPSADTNLIGAVSAAHFMSHFYMLLLPPLFLFVRDDYGVSFTELGIALAVFNVVSAVFQTPAGFLVDRMSARNVLIVGLLMQVVAFAVVALTNSFWLLVAMFALAGLGNTVYHPADYALLSRHVRSERIGQAYSIHSFAGYAGTAAAPVCMLLMHSLWGWRGAFLASALVSVVIAGWLLTLRDEPTASATTRQSNGETAAWSLLLSEPILRNLFFYVLLAIFTGGIANYLVVALHALHGTAVDIGNTVLTAYLTASAIGVLAGGFVAARTTRHVGVAATGLSVATVLTLIIAFIDLSLVPLFLLMVVGGFFSGAIVPSRDMIVRESTPPGSFGKVFGFVSTGFNIGGTVAPMIFGMLMDHGSPRMVFIVVAAALLLCIATIVTGTRKIAAV